MLNTCQHPPQTMHSSMNSACEDVEMCSDGAVCPSQDFVVFTNSCWVVRCAVEPIVTSCRFHQSTHDVHKYTPCLTYLVVSSVSESHCCRPKVDLQWLSSLIMQSQELSPEDRAQWQKRCQQEVQDCGCRLQIHLQ